MVGGQVAIRIMSRSAVASGWPARRRDRRCPRRPDDGRLSAMPVRQWHRQTATLARLARRKPGTKKTRSRSAPRRDDQKIYNFMRIHLGPHGQLYYFRFCFAIFTHSVVPGAVTNSARPGRTRSLHGTGPAPARPGLASAAASRNAPALPRRNSAAQRLSYCATAASALPCSSRARA